MKVCISAFLFTTEQGKKFAGVGRNMYANLAELCTRDRGIQLEIFVKDSVEIPTEWQTEWVTWHKVPIKGVAQRLYWEHFKIGREAQRLGCDLVHSLFATVPFGCRIPVTTLIHDAFPRTHPEWYTGRNRLILDKMTATGCRVAKNVATVSEFSANELSRAYSVSREKFDVVFNGPGNDSFVLSDEERAKSDRTGLPELDGPFLFTVCTLEPRKNLKGLIQAMESVPDVPLLIAGAKGWLESDLAEVVNQSPAKNRILFLGYVSDFQLNLLLNECALFVLASHVEGFGIPVLEAMMAGAAVACSRTSSLPEVAGECAHYFDPSDPTDMARVINYGLEHPEELEALAKKGRERATMFSWEASVDKLVEMFRKAV